MTATAIKTTELCDIAKVEIGSIWTEHDVGEVIAIRGNKMDVKGANGAKYEISTELVERLFSFADQFDETVKVTRTEMIGIIKSNPQTAMTVSFCKKPDAKIIAATLENGKAHYTERQWNKIVKDLIAGEIRTMIGQHFGIFDEHERLKFSEYGKGPRLVDTRTLLSIIVRRTSYLLK